MNQKPYFCWTAERLNAGLPPYILRWGYSAKSLAKQWKKKMAGTLPVRVQAAMWDVEKATWVIDPEGEVWEEKRKEQK